MDASKQKDNKKKAQAKSGKKPTTLVVRQQKSPVIRSASPHYSMSKCGQTYMHALYDPFTAEGNICVPALLPLPSQKIKVLTRGTFQLSTSGFGGVAFWPFRMRSRDFYMSGPNIMPAVVTSNNTTADTDFKFTNYTAFDPAVVTGVTGYAGLTSPYSVADLDTGFDRAVKLVASGIRVCYEDKEIDRSGVYVTWRNPAVSAATGVAADDLSTFLAYNMASQTRVSDLGSAGVSYLPVVETDLQAQIASSAGTIQSGIQGRLAGAVFIANGQPSARYAFECVAHFEVYGRSIPTTPSHSDVQAVSIAVGASTSIPPNPSLSNQLADAVRNAYQRANDNQMSIDLGGLGRLFAQMGAAYLKKRLVEAAPRLVYKGARRLLM